VGVTLEISPSINQDRTVTLKILSEIGNLVLGGGPPFNYNVGGVPQTGATDTVEKTEIEDIIVALNGQTLAIGGLIREEDTKNTEKVPFLGDIPILGFFFRSTEDVQEKREIVFTITPHIMMSPAEIGHMSDRVMQRLSDHPFYREKRERILHFDKEQDKVFRIEKAPQAAPEGSRGREGDARHSLPVRTGEVLRDRMETAPQGGPEEDRGPAGAGVSVRSGSSRGNTPWPGMGFVEAPF
jgi:Flp pilus assembly secretin CpaC